MSKHIQRPLGFALVGVLFVLAAQALIGTTNNFQVDKLGSLAGWVGVALIVCSLAITAWRLIRGQMKSSSGVKSN
jgi:hypothetical protein